MTIKPVPDIGLREDVQFRVGETFGPFRVELFDADKVAATLPGATLGGKVWPRANPAGGVALTVAFSDGTNTAVDFFLGKAATAALTGSGSVFKAAPSYDYHVWYETAGGVRKTLVYGTGDAADGAPA